VRRTLYRMTILEKLRRFRFRVFGHGLEPERSLDNTDGLVATDASSGRLDPQSGTGHAGAPVGYVKTDDGRPR
jgi:hypothetical protein